MTPIRKTILFVQQLIFIQSLVLFGYYLLIPSEENNIFWFRYSASRIALLILILFLVLGNLVLYFNFRTKSETNISQFMTKFRPQVNWMLLFGYLLASTLTVSDSFWPETHIGYLYQLRPFLIYFSLSFIQLIITFILLAIAGDSAQKLKHQAVKLLKFFIYLAGLFIFSKPFWPLKDIPTYDHLGFSIKLIFFISVVFLVSIDWLDNWESRKQRLNTFLARAINPLTLFILAGFLITWAVIHFTGFGAVKPADYWNSGGVPVQLHQLIFIAFVVFELKQYLGQKKVGIRREWIFALAIWLASCVLWISQPMNENTYANGPLPPENIIVPMNDAATVNLGAQSILIGENIFIGSFIDKPLYMLFLAGINTIFGYKYHIVTTVQILVLSFTPVLYFYIGRILLDKYLGLLLVLFTITQETNAIAMIRQDIQVHPKILMAEHLVELMIAITVFVTIKYISQSGLKRTNAALIGVLFGLAGLTRLNGFILLFLIFFGLVVYSISMKILRENTVSLLIMIVSFATVIAPYSIYTTEKVGQPYFMDKTEGVINRNNDGQAKRDFLESTNEKPVIEESLNQLSTLPELKTKTGLPVSLVYLDHIVHNELMTMVEFPIDAGMLPIEQYTKTPIWFASNIWHGKFTAQQALFFTANLCLLSIGIGWAFKQYGAVGIVPLVYHLGYNLTNAAALTSGGRYIAPSEAGLYFYYLVGIYVFIISMKAEIPEAREPVTRSSSPAYQGIAIAGIILGLLIAVLLPNTDHFIPKKYPIYKGQEVLSLLSETEYQTLAAHNVALGDIIKFLEQPEANIFLGRGFYPVIQKFPEREVNYWFTLSLVKPGAALYVRLVNPDKIVDHFPNTGDTIVLGCKEERKNFQALLIISLEEPVVIKSRYFNIKSCADL